MCRRRAFLALAVLLAALGGCRQGPPIREFTLVGQITAVERQLGFVTVRHQDIKGFMPAMTMPFEVRDRALLEGREPGDLIEATLHVQETEAWIVALRKTGTAPLPAAAERPEAGLKPGDRVPDETFIGADGQPLTTAWLDGHASAITFVYTRCPLPDFCPAIDTRFRQVQKSAGPRGIRLLSVTIDPEHDTPAVLAAHAGKVGANPATWRYVTMAPEAMAAFGRQFGVDVKRSGASAADIEHNLRTVVLDRDRRIIDVLTGSTWTAGDLEAQLAAVDAQ
jgi:protein SCO1/2